MNEIQVWLKSKVRGTIRNDLHTFMTTLITTLTTVTTDFPVIIVIKLTNVPIVTFASIVKKLCYGYYSYANMPEVLHSVYILYLFKL